MRRSMRQVRRSGVDVTYEFTVNIEQLRGLVPNCVYGVKWRRGEKRKGKTPAVRGNPQGVCTYGHQVTLTATIQPKAEGGVHKKKLEFTVKQYPQCGSVPGQKGKGTKLDVKFKLNLEQYLSSTSRRVVLQAKKTVHAATLQVTVAGVQRGVPGLTTGAAAAGNYSSGRSPAYLPMGEELEQPQMHPSTAWDDYMTDGTGVSDEEDVFTPSRQPSLRRSMSSPSLLATPADRKSARSFRQSRASVAGADDIDALLILEHGKYQQLQRLHERVQRENDLLMEQNAQLRSQVKGGTGLGGGARLSVASRRSLRGAGADSERASLLRPLSDGGSNSSLSLCSGIIVAYIFWAALGFVHGFHWIFLAWWRWQWKPRPSVTRWGVHVLFYWGANAAFWIVRQTMGKAKDCPGGESMSRDCLFNVQSGQYATHYVIHIVLLVMFVVHWVFDGILLWHWAWQTKRGKSLRFPCKQHSHYWLFGYTTLLTALIVLIWANISWSIQ